MPKFLVHESEGLVITNFFDGGLSVVEAPLPEELIY